MMQSYKNLTLLIFKRLYNHHISILCLSFLFVGELPINASQQINIKGSFVGGRLSSNDENLKGNDIHFEGSLHGDYSITSWLDIIVKDRFDGLNHIGDVQNIDAITSASQLSSYNEKKIKTSNDGLFGVRFTPIGELIISQRVLNMFDNKLELDENPEFPYYNPNDPAGWGVWEFVRNSKWLSNVYWIIPINKIKLGTDFSYVTQYYKINSMDYNYDTKSYDSIAETSFGSDINFWSKLAVSYVSNFSIGAILFKKNNFSGRSTYDFTQYNLFITSTHKFPSNNKITWSLSGRWYESLIMAENNYANNLSGELYVRDVLSLNHNLFIKSTATVRWGKYGMLKQRYEISIRKANRKRSNLEVGGYTNMGGLFPTLGPYIRSNLRIGNRLNLLARGKFIFENHFKENDYVNEWMKWNIEPKVDILITDWLNVFIGAEYLVYNSELANEYPNKASVFLGVRSIFK